MTTFVIASANPHKADEIRAILRESLGASFELIERPKEIPEVEETGSTLLDNARLKAEALCLAMDMPAVADDTGLEVDFLGGAPGVYSARYAGEHVSYSDNVDKLLRELDGATDRAARFHTVALARYPDGTELVAEGSVAGVIAPSPSGVEGFGYDPVFVPEAGDGRTFAEMSASEKHGFSHRGQAFRALADMMRALDVDFQH